MREIILDTETTGLDVAGDRIVEIGCVELENHFPTGRTFQVYINPDRPMAREAQEVHGLTDAFLADKPRFAAIADEFLQFVSEGALVAHNAEFDLGFLNAELARLGRPALDRMRVVDSLSLARRRHPAGPYSLDALCGRYGIDATRRTLHGALLDAQLLAEVYIELIGGRQGSLFLGDFEEGNTGNAIVISVRGPRPTPLPSRLSDADLAAHAALIGHFEGRPIWLDYIEIRQAAE